MMVEGTIRYLKKSNERIGFVHSECPPGVPLEIHHASHDPKTYTHRSVKWVAQASTN